MKIGYLTQWFQPEPNPRGLSLAKELQSKGHTVKVLTGFPNYPYGKVYQGYKLALKRRENLDGVSILRVFLYPSHDKSKIKRAINYITFSLSAAIFGIREFRDCDVIIAYQDPISYILPVFVFKYILRKRVVIDVQDIWPEALYATGMLKNNLLYKALEWICTFNYNLADAIAVISNGFKERLVRRGIKPEKISVIYNWCLDEEVFLNAKGTDDLPGEDKAIFEKKSDQELNFVFAGNIGKAQGLSSLIDAFERLKSYPIKLVIIGDGVERQSLIEYAQKIDANNVFFIDRKPVSEIWKYLIKADALIVHLKKDSALTNTIPSKTQTYMAIGKPILMMQNGDAARLINGARCGFECEPENVEEMQKVIKRVIELDKKSREEMALNARSYYISNLSRSIGIMKFENILKKSMSNERFDSNHLNM